MCTLILGIGIFGAQSLLLGANRDEDPARPSEPPARLIESPSVVGGRDRLAGGTWLALLGREATVAMLNRRGMLAAPATRSRGLLTLDVARQCEPATAFEHLVRECYAPFTMVLARPARTWLLAWDGAVARMSEPPPGWHVLTHTEMDDAQEPRAAWVLNSLATFKPATPEEARRGVIERLSRHEAPAVCVHEGPVRTVSSSWVEFGSRGVRFEHAEGPPCTTRFVDYTSLLVDNTVTSENT